MNQSAALAVMDKKYRTFGLNDKGAIAPMFAVLAIILLSLGALSIDISRAYVLRADLEAAVDAAAIAAASQLDGKSGSISRARAAARGGFIENSQRVAKVPEVNILIGNEAFCFMALPQSTCTQEETLAKYVTIKLEPREMNLVFGKLVDVASLQVTAQATAGITVVPSAEACGEPLLVCADQISTGFDPADHVGRSLVLEPRHETGSQTVQSGETCNQECRAVQTGQSCNTVCEQEAVPGQCRWETSPGACETRREWQYVCSGYWWWQRCGWERVDVEVCEPDTQEQVCDPDTTTEVCRQECVPTYETQCENVCTPSYVTQTTFGGNYALLTPDEADPVSAIDLGRRDTELCYTGSGIIEEDDEDDIEEYLNTRFDIYQGAANSRDDDPDFLPAINTMVGDKEKGEDVCDDVKAKKPENETSDYDYPMAFPLDEDLSDDEGGLGDGDWSLNKYLQANHHDSSAVSVGLNSFGPAPSGGSSSTTRYQVYNWETAQVRGYYADNGPSWLRSKAGFSGYAISQARKAFDEDQLYPDDDDDYQDWDEDQAPPMCNIAGLSNAPPVRDRRLVRAVLADCGGRSPGEEVSPVGTIDLFLTSPSYNGFIFTEIVGGQLSNDKQTVRLVE
jgi:hypothetical protein